MKDCSPSITPIVKGDRFNLDQCPKNDLEREKMKNIPYASAVGSLMYVHVCTIPDIAFAVGMLGRYQSNPSIDHWIAAKKVMSDSSLAAAVATAPFDSRFDPRQRRHLIPCPIGVSADSCPAGAP